MIERYVCTITGEVLKKETSNGNCRYRKQLPFPIQHRLDGPAIVQEGKEFYYVDGTYIGRKDCYEVNVDLEIKFKKAIANYKLKAFK